ncbi:hypothetical protein [Streptomyces coelicoflavus]|uniref:hypothetical protein n=1 Tax=Streptomyces coelicoflavus TaxID=285562 RepID=UPI00142D60CC|nr:hypothetical protein [Streptomyces coelicoflavus]
MLEAAAPDARPAASRRGVRAWQMRLRQIGRGPPQDLVQLGLRAAGERMPITEIVACYVRTVREWLEFMDDAAC